MSLLFGRLRLPYLVGLFMAGALVGPNGLGLIRATDQVELLAEAGVVFLLFSLGLEFSSERLKGLWRALAIAGPIQVLATVGVVFLGALVFGRPLSQAVLLGMLVALSSTAVVLRVLQERAQTETPQGQSVLGILVFQDLAVVPMILAVPLLAGSRPTITADVALAVVLGVATAFLLVVAARWVVPRLLLELTRTQDQDAFLVGVVVVCLGAAALSARAGLSLALGAFLAGLLIAESDFGYQALGHVLPLRNLLMSFFFVSVGMLLDVRLLVQNWWLVLLALVAVFIVKAVTGTVAVLALRYPLRMALIAGFTLCQVGEFSFVLAATAGRYELLPRNLEQGFLAVTVVTMAVTPLIAAKADSFAGSVCRLLPRRAWGLWVELPTEPDAAPADHLLIVGYGLNGRNLAVAACEAGIPYAIVELNPHTVRVESGKGQPMHYGDATNSAVVEHAGARTARAAAIVINDPAATRRIVALLRSLNPGLYIVARTRFVTEVEPLSRLGASEVVPEEYETSLEMLSLTLRSFTVPEEAVRSVLARVRADQYRLLRSSFSEREDTVP